MRGQEIHIAIQRGSDASSKSQFDRFHLRIKLAEMGRESEPFLNEQTLDRLLNRALSLRDKRIEVSRSERVPEKNLEGRARNEVRFKCGTDFRLTICVDHSLQVDIREIFANHLSVRLGGERCAIKDQMDDIPVEIGRTPGDGNDVMIIEIGVRGDRPRDPVPCSFNHEQIEDAVVDR